MGMIRKSVTLFPLMLLGSALSQVLEIKSMDDFNKFVDGTMVLKEVYLETDLDFTSVTAFKPLQGFNGTFDGRGHIISNLKIESSDMNVGFFATMESSTVKNLILDASCSVKSTLSVGSFINVATLGSIVGSCKMCTFENIINHASVTFASSAGFEGSLSVGGIAGEFWSDRKNATMTNVVNYGAVLNNLENADPVDIYIYTGGLVGYSAGVNKFYPNRLEYINCANFGSVTSKSADPSVAGTGGISGVAFGHPALTSVLSAGEVVVPENAIKGSFFGLGIYIGKTDFNSSYVTPSIEYKQYFGIGKNGYEISTDDAPDLTDQTFLSLNQFKVWLYNPNKVAIEFHVSDNTPITLSSEAVIMPFVTNMDQYIFKGWFADSDCQVPLVNYKIEAATSIYAGWMYYVHLDPEGGEIEGKTDVFLKEVIYTHKVGPFPEPTRTGYKFAGWFSPFFENKLTEDLVYSLTQNSTFRASWNKLEYEVTFDFGNGSPAHKELVLYEGTITYPEDPVRDEHIFLGWNRTDEHGQNITVMPAYNFTISAIWKINQYDVTFIYYEDKVETKKCDFNSPIEYPDDPIREGYAFVSWDKNDLTVPSGGIVISAIWIRANYTLTFDFANGSEPITFSVTYNDTIEFPPENPVKKGFTFSYWYPSDVKRMPPRNFTLTASYATNFYRLVFDYANGTVIEDALDYNKPIPYPKNMVREGCTFIKWDKDIEYMPDDALYLTALWSVNNYTATFLFNNPDGSEVKIYHFGDDVVYPDEPVMEGHVFYRWDQIYDKMPSYDITVRAQWLEPTRFVSIIFDSDAITIVDANETFSNYTTDAFVIDKLEVIEGRTLVMISFEDKEKAESFFKKLRVSNDMEIIVDIDFLVKGPTSFSPMNYASPLLNLLFLV